MLLEGPYSLAIFGELQQKWPLGVRISDINLLPYGVRLKNRGRGRRLATEPQNEGRSGTERHCEKLCSGAAWFT